MNELDKRRENELVSQNYTVSQEKINQYAEVSGGMGAIHTDPEYAKSTYFKNTLVHGLYVLALMEKEFNLKMDNSLKSGRINVTYLRPIVAGQPFHFKYIESSPGEWEATVWSNDEKMIIGSISV